MSDRNGSYAKVIAMFAIGLILAILTLYFIGFDELITTISKINPLYYSLAILCFIGTLLSWTLRWKGFLKAAGYDLKVKDLLVSLIVGLGINNLTPVAKLGGEPVRAFMLKKKKNIQMRESFGTIVADLSLEFLASTLMLLGSFILITVFLNPPHWLFVTMLLSLTIGLISIFSIFGLFSSEKYLKKILHWFVSKINRLKPFQDKILDVFGKFQETFKKGFKSKKVAGKAVYYSFLIKFFDVIRYYLIFQALGYNISLLHIFIAVGFLGLLMTIPATPGSLGVLEGGMVIIFTLLGIPAAISGTAVFLERLLSFWSMLIIGGISGSFYGVEMLESKDEIFSSD